MSFPVGRFVGAVDSGDDMFPASNEVVVFDLAGPTFSADPDRLQLLSLPPTANTALAVKRRGGEEADRLFQRLLSPAQPVLLLRRTLQRLHGDGTAARAAPVSPLSSCTPERLLIFSFKLADVADVVTEVLVVFREVVDEAGDGLFHFQLQLPPLPPAPKPPPAPYGGSTVRSTVGRGKTGEALAVPSREEEGNGLLQPLPLPLRL